MSKAQIRQKAFAFQQYKCTKKLFLAVHNKKHVVVYGNVECGKENLERHNGILLREYNRLYFDFDDKGAVTEFLKQAAQPEPPLYVIANYSSAHPLNLPLENVEEILMHDFKQDYLLNRFADK